LIRHPAGAATFRLDLHIAGAVVASQNFDRFATVDPTGNTIFIARATVKEYIDIIGNMTLFSQNR
jgi:hypothetical protein